MIARGIFVLELPLVLVSVFTDFRLSQQGREAVETQYTTRHSRRDGRVA